MTNLLQHLRPALLLAARNRRVSVVLVLTIATAICINGTVFTAVDAVVFRPLPFRNPDDLLRIVATRQGVSGAALSELELNAFRQDLVGCESIATYFRQPEDRFDLDTLVRFVSIPVSTNFFELLGVAPALGRTFLPEDRYPSPVVVISHGLWQRRFGGLADVLGQSLRFDGASYEIVGVMPPSFHHTDGLPADVWTPSWPMPNATARRDNALCRLRADHSREQAQAEVDVLASRLGPLQRDANAGWRARLVPLHQVIVGRARDQLLVLLLGVAMLLVLACANVGSILLARNVGRRQEFHVRLALGSTKGRLVREAVLESAVLALFGGIVGMILTSMTMSLILTVAPATLPRLGLAAVNARVWLWVLSTTVAVGMLSGLAPALAAWRIGAEQWVRDGARSTADRQGRRLIAVLVAAEVALATVLVASAGLMAQTLLHLRRIDLGFQPAGMVAIYLRPGWGAATGGPDMAIYYQELRRRLERLSGVQAVGAAKGLPLTTFRQMFDVGVTTDATPPGDAPITATSWIVVPGYFEAMRVPLVRGRYFDPADDVESRDVAIVSALLAQRAFGAQDPIGRHVTLTSGAPRRALVVGVVGDVITSPEMPAKATIYVTRSNTAARLSINLAIRVDAEPTAIVPRIRDEIVAVEPNVAILDISTMNEALDNSVAYPRFLTVVLNLFGAAGLLLAAIGIYGVGSYGAAQRRQEIGVRMAVGADRRSVVRLVVGEGVLLALVGLVIGVSSQVAVTKYLGSVLYGLSAADAATAFATFVILLLVTTSASYIPARRASRVDPSCLLRAE
jgi:putative ABC transport system permease protein